MFFRPSENFYPEYHADRTLFSGHSTVSRETFADVRYIDCFNFFAGLIPVVGNLISNTFIAILSLGDSLTVAAMSLIWLIAIHKLEYFLNAHIIGHKIKAAAWELLIAMLVMEAAFGLAGLISAPIIYAQLKKALVKQGWI